MTDKDIHSISVIYRRYSSCETIRQGRIEAFISPAAEASSARKKLRTSKVTPLQVALGVVLK